MVFTAAWTYNPAPLAHALTDLRFSLLKAGHNISAFHAAEDRQVNRDAVVQVLAAHDDWSFVALVVDKAKVNPSIREPHRFYPKFASMTLRYVLRRLAVGTDRVLVFTDTIPINEKRDSIEKAIKIAGRADLPASVRFESYHHPRWSNCWIQAADYCSWAVFRKWEHGDPRTYNLLAARLRAPELDVLQRGATRYYLLAS
jgi:hypothetical protein